MIAPRNLLMDFMPHGSCFRWDPWLLWTYVGAHIGVAAAYLVGVPWWASKYWREAGRMVSRPTIALMVAFVASCGLTHLAAAANVWCAHYWVEVVIDSATAAISWAFVVVGRRESSHLGDAVRAMERSIADASALAAVGPDPVERESKIERVNAGIAELERLLRRLG